MVLQLIKKEGTFPSSSSKINFPSNNSWRFFNIVSNDFGIAIFESSFQLWEVIQLIFDHFISIFDDWYVNQDFNQIDSLTCFQGVLGEFSTQQVVDDGRFSCAPWPQEKHQGFRKDLRICVLHRYYNISGLLLFFFFEWMYSSRYLQSFGLRHRCTWRWSPTNARHFQWVFSVLWGWLQLHWCACSCP